MPLNKETKPGVKPYDVVTNMLDYDSTISEFELQLPNYDYFRTNISRKGMSPQLWFELCFYSPFAGIDLALDNKLLSTSVWLLRDQRSVEEIH